MAVLAADPAEVVGGRRASLSTWLVLTLIALSALRAAFAASIPLTEDEAYYRLWAEHLAFGYFDHPPMSAWWIAAGRAVFGDTPFADRALPIVSTVIVSLLLVDLSRTLGFSRATAERAALWYNAAFLIALGGAVITPDAPATLFWTLCLWAAARAWRSERLSWWAVAGAAAGLGCLSKYSALFIGPGVLLWLLTSAKGRRLLASPGPWLALVVGAAVFSPNLAWNAGHHWLSFVKQFSRIAPSGFTPRHVLDFPATQFLLLNPIVAVFAAKGLATIDWRSPQGRSAALLPLAILPFALYLFVHSFHDGVQAHWPAPLYPALAVIAAAAAEASASRRWRAAAAAVPVLGFGLSALAFVHLAAPATDIGRKDPALPLRGWSRFAGEVEALRLRTGAGWTGTFSYGTAAELLAQGRTAAPVLELIERARYGFQGAPSEPRGAGVVVELKRRLLPEDLTACFASVRALPDLGRGDPGGASVAYAAYLVEGPRTALAATGCREGKDRPKPNAAS